MPPPEFAKLTQPVEQFGVDGITLMTGSTVQVLSKAEHKIEVQSGTQVGSISKSQLDFVISHSNSGKSPSVKKSPGPLDLGRIPSPATSLAISRKGPRKTPLESHFKTKTDVNGSALPTSSTTSTTTTPANNISQIASNELFLSKKRPALPPKINHASKFISTPTQGSPTSGGTQCILPQSVPTSHVDKYPHCRQGPVTGRLCPTSITTLADDIQPDYPLSTVSLSNIGPHMNREGSQVTRESVWSNTGGLSSNFNCHNNKPVRGNASVLSDNLARKSLLVNGKAPRIHPWATHWAVVTGQSLYLYKDNRRVSPSKPQLEVDLGGYNVRVASEYSKKQNVLLLTSGDGNTKFYLETPNSRRMLDWKLALLEAAKLKQWRVCNVLAQSISDIKRGPFSQDRHQFKEELAKWWLSRPTMDVLISLGIMKDCYFGCSLPRVTAREGVQVPRFVTSCIEKLETEIVMKEEGIYRVPGNLSLIQQIRAKADQGDLTMKIEFTDTDFSRRDVHAITGALKLYLRELPEPLTTFESFRYWRDIAASSDELSLKIRLKETVHRLPPANYATLHALVSHLSKVAKYFEYNKMTNLNLAIVFGPTLIRPQKETPLEAIDNVNQSKIVMEKLLEHSNYIFDYV
eukprot:CFRG3649T1